MIPAMTDPMGRYWDQPPTSAIEIDATHARMTSATFKHLAEYSGTIPTGVYPGKMWRRHDGIFARKRQEPPKWLLCWYGDDVNGKCEIFFREVQLTDSGGSEHVER
jgi:hypothetical protein